MALKPEEVYAILLRKLKEGGATPEQIQSAVENYLSQNPINPQTLTVEDHIISLKEGS